MAETPVSMRRLKDSPTDQDVGALGKIGQTKCDICGEEGADHWLHSDSWTKWLRFGCGCTLMTCGKAECAAGAEVLRKQLIAQNREKAEAAEREMLKATDAGSLSSLRYRYFEDFNCGQQFRDWVSSVVGEERMREILDVACRQCGKPLGQTRYTFQTPEGVRSLKTIDEIEIFCYERMGRDPQTEPFRTQTKSMGDDFRVGGMNEAEIGFERSQFHYFVQKGWPTENMTEQRERWDEAWHATKGQDCGGTNDWSYGYFIYYLPTTTFLGQMMKRHGDWVQIVQLNRKQVEEAQTALRAQYGENYHEHKEFWEQYNEINKMQEWGYFCGKECCSQATTEEGTIFI